MSETSVSTGRRRRIIHHRGRLSQIPIYLGKQFRFFVNESDWKVIPMAAVIGGLVSMVIRKRFFINMEGGLIGAFALACVAIWNGCFNSIQTICRERAIVKREHRSGMHITSYVAAHMIYQLFLCVTQTVVTIYVMKTIGVKFPEEGFMTKWSMLDIGITMLLITYAADMMSLFISSISHTTTSAMTIMPFVLIFQLVFAGSIIPLPEWGKPLANYTISSYGIKALAAQSGYNELPMVAGWNIIDGMREKEIKGSVTVGQILDVLDNPALEEKRDMEILRSYTVGDIAKLLNRADEYLHLREKTIVRPFTVRSVLEMIQNSQLLQPVLGRKIFPAIFGEYATLGGILRKVLNTNSLQNSLETEIGKEMTLGEVLDMLEVEEYAETNSEKAITRPITLGDLIDFIKNNETLNAQRDRQFSFGITVGEILDAIGEERVKTFVEKETAKASQKPEYEKTPENIIRNWLMLGAFILFFALLTTISLKLIDKDKR